MNLAVQKSQIYSVVDQLFSGFEEHASAKADEIARLHEQLESARDLEQENTQLKERLAHLEHLLRDKDGTNIRTLIEKESHQPRHEERGSNTNHASCCERIKILQEKYNKLWQEARAQETTARKIEVALEKSRSKLREWQDWQVSSDMSLLCSPKDSSKLAQPGKILSTSRSNTHDTLHSVPPNGRSLESLKRSPQESRANESSPTSSPGLPPNPTGLGEKMLKPQGLRDAAHERNDNPPRPRQTPRSTKLAKRISSPASPSRVQQYRESFSEPALRPSDKSFGGQSKQPGSMAQGASVDTPIQIESDDSPSLPPKGQERAQEISFVSTLDLSLDAERPAAPLDGCLKRHNRRRSFEFAQSEYSPTVPRRIGSDPMKSYPSRAKRDATSGTGPLRPVACGTRELSYKTENAGTPALKKRKVAKDTMKAIPYISEDGERIANQLSSRSLSKSPNPQALQRLENLMEGRSSTTRCMRNWQPNWKTENKRKLTPQVLEQTPRENEDQASVPLVIDLMDQPATQQSSPLAELSTSDSSKIESNISNLDPQWRTSLFSLIRKKLLNRQWQDVAISLLKHKDIDQAWYNSATNLLQEHNEAIPQIPTNIKPPPQPEPRHQPSSHRTLETCNHNTGTVDSPPPTPSPSNEPLRSRPLSKLTLSDFKIDPTANSGLDYAYTDVVRHQALRKCLSGCTDPSCCGGQFRALAKDLPSLSLLPPKSLFSSHSCSTPPQTDAEADERLIATYLADEQAPAQLSQGERERVLLEAKTKEEESAGVLGGGDGE
ncbi:MAG: hypothetical protein Q9227_008619 [Pyrenula ochraceoflavens]